MSVSDSDEITAEDCYQVLTIFRFHRNSTHCKLYCSTLFPPDESNERENLISLKTGMPVRPSRSVESLVIRKSGIPLNMVVVLINRQEMTSDLVHGLCHKVPSAN